MKFKLSIILLSICLLSCKKSVFNYRHKYIGNWVITTTYNLWAGPTIDTTVTSTYKGKITYGDDENEIIIHNFQNSSLPITVYTDGGLYEVDQGKCGLINKKTLTLVLKYYTPGSRTTYTITGKKIKDLF